MMPRCRKIGIRNYKIFSKLEGEGEKITKKLAKKNRKKSTIAYGSLYLLLFWPSCHDGGHT